MGITLRNTENAQRCTEIRFTFFNNLRLYILGVKEIIFFITASEVAVHNEILFFPNKCFSYF
jgi:hypothetical protein